MEERTAEEILRKNFEDWKPSYFWDDVIKSMEEFADLKVKSQSIKEEQPKEGGVWVTERKLRKTLAAFYRDIEQDKINYTGVMLEGLVMDWMDKNEIIENITYENNIKEESKISDENGWINVDDDLPPFDVKVLVLGEQKGMNPQMGGAYVSIARRQDLSKTSMARDIEKMQDKNQFSMMSYVTHWQHLPNNPKNKQP